MLGFSAETETTVGGQYCEPYSSNGDFVGCTNPTDNCDPDTVHIVQSYLGVDGNSNLLKSFFKSFKKLLSVGYGTGSKNLGGLLVDLDLSTC